MGIKASIIEPSRILFGKAEGEEVIVLYNRHLTEEMYKTIKASEGLNVKPIILFVNTWHNIDKYDGIKGKYIIVIDTRYIKVTAVRPSLVNMLPSSETHLVADLLKEFSTYNPDEDPIVEPIDTVVERGVWVSPTETNIKEDLIKLLRKEATIITTMETDYNETGITYTIEIKAPYGEEGILSRKI